MGKKDKKKKGLGKAKTEQKAAKKAEKAAKKARAATGDKDVEALLAEIEAQEELEDIVTEYVDCDAPSPRSHFTMIASPLRDTDLVFFGGERFTGDNASFYNDLYTFHTEKHIWTKYTSANRPAPRSSHAVATYKNWMYMFGGEFSNPSLSQYKHYRDLWRLDLTDMDWDRVEIRGGPCARSGHRMAVARGKLFVFGGFSDSGYEAIKYYNDLYYIDLTADELKWTKVDYGVADIVPSPRSGFQWMNVENDIFLYGGYSRELVAKAKAISHKSKKKGGGAVEQSMQARGVVQSDLFKLSTETMKWNKMRKSGYGPSARSGFGMVLHKGALVVFGGVEDDETEADLDSVFHADIFALDVQRRKWYPMTLRRKGAKKRRRRRKGAGPSSAGTDVVEVEEEKNDAEPMDISENKENVAADDDDDGEELDAEKMEAAFKEMVEEEPAPCARFNSAVTIQKNTMYIAGGCVEMKEQEMTLDDIWSIDLSKMDEFKQLKDLSEECTKWVASDSEDEEADADDGDEVMDDMDDDDEMDDEEMDGKKRREMRREKLRSRVQHADGSNLTPMVNESLKLFFDRTKKYWIGEVHEALGIGGKELRREAFGWACKRYWEIKPSLRELEELEAELKREEELEIQFQQTELENKKARSRR